MPSAREKGKREQEQRWNDAAPVPSFPPQPMPIRQSDFPRGQVRNSFQNPATDRYLCHRTRPCKPYQMLRIFQNPATDRYLCHSHALALREQVITAFRILPRIDTSATCDDPLTTTAR